MQQLFTNYYKQPTTTYSDINIQYPYRTKRKICVFGGHDTWYKAIKLKLPKVRFIKPNQLPSQELIKNQDVIWIQPNCISHCHYKIIVNTAKTYNIPLYHFIHASALKCANDIVANELYKN